MKIQHACFNCRKSWKKLVADDDWEAYTKESEFVCPECGKILSIMGKNFRAPKIDKIKEWKIVEKLHENGFRFIGNGAGAYKYPKLPTKLSEVDKFIKENPNHYMKVHQGE